MKIAIIALLSLISWNVIAQEATAEQVFDLSRETRKPVLIIFSGSDWCAPCIRFDKKVIADNSFQAFAKENLIILKADFPQRKKIADDLKKQNEALAEKYNPKGLFPHLVLVIPGQSAPVVLSYTHQTSDEFIYEINSHLAK